MGTRLYRVCLQCKPLDLLSYSRDGVPTYRRYGSRMPLHPKSFAVTRRYQNSQYFWRNDSHYMENHSKSTQRTGCGIPPHPERDDWYILLRWFIPLCFHGWEKIEFLLSHHT